jgi:hypothetical protein
MALGLLALLCSWFLLEYVLDSEAALKGYGAFYQGYERLKSFFREGRGAESMSSPCHANITNHALRTQKKRMG